MTRGMAGADVVFHLAWAGLDMRGPILSLCRNNVGGTQCAARAAAAAGVRRFVFTSTEAVLFGAPIEQADEAAPFPEPAHAAFGAMNPYSVTKARYLERMHVARNALNLPHSMPAARG
jgi:nucleoside-diphosphate-sugar epimerase